MSSTTETIQSSSKSLWVDPPSGWKYGFPRIVPKEHQHRVVEWMVEVGYPQSLVDHLGEQFYFRCWEE